MKGFVFVILFFVSFSNTAHARHFELSDSLLAENDTLISQSISFKTKKKSGQILLHKKSYPFIDSLGAFLIKNREVEIEIIRFHSPLVRQDYTFIGNDCKPYTELDLVANYLANMGIAILRISLRNCQMLPIATGYGMENRTIIRITKVKKKKGLR